MNITKYFTTKPIFNEESKQLFATDVNSSGAKNGFSIHMKIFMT